MADKPLLEVKDLVIHYETDDGVVKALNGVNIHIGVGETLGLVGETGAGKTTLAKGIMRLIPNPPGKILGGEVIFEGQDLLKLSTNGMEAIRGRDISMIFQDPMTSLNPVLTVGEQIMEVIENHNTSLSRQEARKWAENMLERVGIPAERFGEYPHQFSGGMKQRVVIAIALACNPRLLIADEPTTALDVTVQAQVLDLLKELRDKYGTAILLITHNLGVVWDMCDSVIVMYAGKTVEYAPCIDLYNHPLHPYTWGLLDCMPRLSSNSKEELSTIAGTPPDLRLTGVGCNFANRCPYAQERCRTEVPELTEVSPGHRVACHRQTGGNRLVRNEVTESGR